MALRELRSQIKVMKDYDNSHKMALPIKQFSYLSLETNKYQSCFIYIGSTQTGGKTREKRNRGSEDGHEGHGGHDRCHGKVYDF